MILFSPSQIKTKRTCVRKWALEKIAGLRGPETAAQSLGKEVDDNNLQPYLRDGKPIDTSTLAGQIAVSGLKWLPQPKWRGLEVQKHFVFRSPSGLDFGYQGYKDLWLPYGGQPGFNNEIPVVADFKTTKSFKYALSENKLRKDEQGVIYGVNAVLETKSPVINQSWLYLLTAQDERDAKVTQITVTTNELAEEFKEIEADAIELFQIRQKAPTNAADAMQYALSLTGNDGVNGRPFSCRDYGGCPHQHHCFKLTDLFDEPSIDPGPEEKREMAEQIDLFASLESKKTAADVADAINKDPAIPATAVVAGPPTQAQIAAEPALPLNPPMAEGTPLAPPVGSAEAKKPRGRPAGAKNKKAEGDGESPAVQVEVSIAPAVASVAGDMFDDAWAKLGVALKNFLGALGVVK